MPVYSRCQFFFHVSIENWLSRDVPESSKHKVFVTTNMYKTFCLQEPQHCASQNGKHVHRWPDDEWTATLSMLNNSKKMKVPSLFQWASDVVRIPSSSSAVPISASALILSCIISLHSLAAKPGILSVGLRDEGNFSGHFHVVDSPAALEVLPLSLSAWLLKVTLVPHRFNDLVLSQHP